MPRAGQVARRKAKAAQAEESDSDEYYMDETQGQGAQGGRGGGKRKLRVLPVAEIEDDWDGEPEDGATYLALVNRANAKLPHFTRVNNPYRQASPPPKAQKVFHAVNGDQIPEAGPSRHPALPRESWTVSFMAHFQNYRKDVRSRWPPEPLPPLPEDMIPFPTNEQVHEWFWFIVGFNRRKINKRSEPNANASNTTSAKGGFSPSRPAEGSRPKAIKPIRGASKGLKASVMPDEDDEEAFMNGPSLSVTNAKTLDSSNDIEGDPDDDDGDEDYDLDEDDEDDDHGNVYDHDIEMTNASNEEATRKKEEAKRSSFKYDLEPETAKHRPRAPTIGLLARLDQHTIIIILIQIGYRLNAQIEDLSNELSFPSSSHPNSLYTSNSTLSSTHRSVANPFTSHLSTWTFSLLALLDPDLSADDLHHLREFARVIIRVGGWRYLRALQDGEIDTNWVLGQTWSPSHRQSQSDTIHGGVGAMVVGEQGVDEALARCWMAVMAIVAGWAQHDLLESLENLFK